MPALADIEFVSILRGLLRGRLLKDERAAEALVDYLGLPLVRHGHAPLLVRALSLGANFSAYDAAYVALAETLDAVLCTRDARLARAVSRHTDLDVVGV